MVERINQLLEKEPSSAKLLYVFGRLAMDMGDLSLAQHALEEAILREPALGICWYTLAMLYSMSGDFKAALAATDRALRDFSDDIALWLTRGQALQDLQRIPEAMECYDRATTIAPDDDMPWFYLGRLLLLELDRPIHARGVLKEALRLHPENDAAMWMLALCHLRTGQSAKGFASCSNCYPAIPRTCGDISARRLACAAQGAGRRPARSHLCRLPGL